jgi:8-oxo-dGTP pyrophosphatase MutT (NUDIX family)
MAGFGAGTPLGPRYSAPMAGTDDRMRAWAERLGPTTAEPGSEAIPAATVVLLRDGPDGIETLVLQRNSKLAFGGMWVFPGGRVDAADHPADAESEPTAALLRAAANAAVREAAEEAGLAVGVDSLSVYAHWSPPKVAPKRFTTWFFVARAPLGDVVVDGGEIHEHAWVRPADGIARRDAGEIELAPPTWVTLHDLARYATVDDALAGIDGREPEFFETQIASVADAIVAMWHGDAGYGSGDPDVAGPRHRLVMADSGWSYERNG